MSSPLHLLRGFVQWWDRDANGRRFQIRTIDEAETYVRRVADAGHDRFYTSTSRRPRRAAEIEGGSVYFVGGPKRNQALFRMPIVGVEGDVCSGQWDICMRPELIRVRQDHCGMVRGWRYLKDSDAPPDLPGRPGTGDLPEDMAAELKELGLA